jgi:transcriptional regulator with GAF, ATPase, and Fis domain
MTHLVAMGQKDALEDAIIGNSRAMENIYKQVGRVAATTLPVLIRGETGTGKELIARAIYQHSDRSGKPFIAVNCAAIPETLLESELFGHECGTFTGAEIRRIGRFEQADGGTIFLDEIGDMSVLTQAKLLRVLQEETIQRSAVKSRSRSTCA